MCMEDVRMGRRTSPEARQFAVPDAGNTIIAPADPFRVSLHIGISTAVAVIVAPQPLDPSAGEGFRLVPEHGFLHADILHDGNLTCMEWRASGDAAAGSVAVMATYLPEG